MGAFSRVQQEKRKAAVSDEEILEQCDGTDWSMSMALEMEEEMKQSGSLWTIEDTYLYLYGWCAYYDEPWKAMAYGNIASPLYRGGDFWRQWKHEHWAGCEGMRERALKDPYVCSYLRRYGLLPIGGVEV